MPIRTAIAGPMLAVLVFSAGEAFAAPPVVCVRNESAVDVQVLAADAPETDGTKVDLGTAAARGGACRYADVNGRPNVYFRRAVADPGGNSNGVVFVADGGWRACPVHDGYVYTIRRGLFRLVCKAGGDTTGLESEGEYE
jgi:hypothetical protein